MERLLQREDYLRQLTLAQVQGRENAKEAK
jgi:hypothetical protein